MTVRDVLLRRLAMAAESLGDDELLVLCEIADRAVMGAELYGPLKLAEDRRDWREEARAEALAGCFYLACNLLQERKANAS